MTIKVRFECDGCDATAEGTHWLKRHFNSFSGKGYGFGTYSTDSAEDVAPDGWVAFDPYTRACYCPKCWAEISDDVTEARKETP